MIKVGIISTFPPTQCGIATYATDLISSLSQCSNEIEFIKFALIHDDSQNGDCSYFINNSEIKNFKYLADFINSAGIDALDIQHEFKIFGKPDGKNIEVLLDNVKIPIVTTLHTVNQKLSTERDYIFRKVLDKSSLLIVFSEDAKLILKKWYSVFENKVEVIPHGVPTIDFVLPQESVLRKQYPQKLIFVSSGLMRETKGYEIAIEALNTLKHEIPEFHYIIIGSNHPQNDSSVIYRERLKNLVNSYNLNDNVSFIDEYLPQTQLIQLIQAADVCLLPYTREEQSSSGVLALMMACGRPVITTPFKYSNSLVSKYSGEVSSTFLPADYAESLRSLGLKAHLWDEIMQYNYYLGRSWNWSKVTNQYLKCYKILVASKIY